MHIPLSDSICDGELISILPTVTDSGLLLKVVVPPMPLPSLAIRSRKLMSSQTETPVLLMSKLFSILFNAEKPSKTTSDGTEYICIASIDVILLKVLNIDKPGRLLMRIDPALSRPSNTLRSLSKGRLLATRSFSIDLSFIKALMSVSSLL